MLNGRLTPQFAAYLVISILLFTAVGVAVIAAGLSPIWAYAAGFIVSLPAEFIRDYFQRIEQEQQNRKVSA